MFAGVQTSKQNTNNLCHEALCAFVKVLLQTFICRSILSFPLHIKITSQFFVYGFHVLDLENELLYRYNKGRFCYMNFRTDM